MGLSLISIVALEDTAETVDKILSTSSNLLAPNSIVLLYPAFPVNVVPCLRHVVRVVLAAKKLKCFLNLDGHAYDREGTAI